MSRTEIRAVQMEARAAGEDGDRVTGRGIVYGKWEEIWPGYRERIRRGAARFANEVKSYFNHDPSQVLSRTTSDPPLQLEETDEGVAYDSPIPDTSYGRDLRENLRTRNVQGSSFAFRVPPGGDRIWEDSEGVVHRDILELEFDEIGPVTDPAYLQTSAVMRETQRMVETRMRGKEVEKRGSALGALIADLRDDAELTNEDLAGAAGVSASAISQMIGGRTQCPTRDHLEGMAGALGVSVDRLISAAEEDGCDYSGGDVEESSRTDSKRLVHHGRVGKELEEFLPGA